jgi:hypothetical protein
VESIDVNMIRNQLTVIFSEAEALSSDAIKRAVRTIELRLSVIEARRKDQTLAS